MFGVYKLRLILYLPNVTLVSAQGLTRRLDETKNVPRLSERSKTEALSDGSFTDDEAVASTRDDFSSTLDDDDEGHVGIDIFSTVSELLPDLGALESFTDQEAKAIARDQAQVDLIQRQNLIEQNKKLAREKKGSLEKRPDQRRQARALQQALQVPDFVLGDNEAQRGEASSLRADEAGSGGNWGKGGDGSTLEG